MKLIALTGRAGSGKDTVADHLCAHHGFTRYAFAKPIKDMLKVIGVDCDNRDTKEEPHPLFVKSPRQMAQTLGTEWGRNMVNPDIWLLLAQDFMDRIELWIDRDGEKDIPKAPKGIVFTDCRFQNEAYFLRVNGAEMWLIERPSVQAVAPHISEAGIMPRAGDIHIRNNGSIADLHVIVNRHMMEIPE